MGHQQHSQVLVDTAQPTAVYLDKLQGRGLEELLEHHPIVTLERKQVTQLKNFSVSDTCAAINVSSDLLPCCHTNPKWSQSLQQQK